MIVLPNANATRLTFKIAASAPPHLGYVKLLPDYSMAATDGIALIHSRAAHNLEIEEPLFLRSRVTPQGGAEEFQLDMEGSKLVEVRPRSRKEYDIEIHQGVGFPNVERAIPSRMTPEAKNTPAFDSIRAGRVASDYGMSIGVWGKWKWDDRVYLLDTEVTDTVVLAAVDRE